VIELADQGANGMFEESYRGYTKKQAEGLFADIAFV
jgi:hypothetical protein